MYCIAILRHAYQPDLQGLESPQIYCGDDYPNPVLYDTVEDAQAQIDDWDASQYVLAHNESGRPNYIIVDDVDAEYILGGRNGDMSNYDWSDAECDCGECSGCVAMMISQDRDYLQCRGHGQ